MPASLLNVAKIICNQYQKIFLQRIFITFYYGQNNSYRNLHGPVSPGRSLVEADSEPSYRACQPRLQPFEADSEHSYRDLSAQVAAF